MLESRDLPPAILLHGEESYLVERGANLLRDNLVPAEAKDFNLTQVHGRDLVAADIVDQALTLPVFSPRRLVLIKYLHEASAEQLDDLVPYLENPSPETVLLMTATKIDGRRKFFQRLRKVGQVFEFKKLYENQLPAQVRDMAAERGLTFTSTGLQLFCRRVGTSLAEVDGELGKLQSYLAERDLIDEEDVVAVVSDTRIESIFALTDAIGLGQADLALRLLNRLLDEGNAPLMVLAMIVRHFRQMWKAHCLLAEGVAQKEMPARVGISPYFLKGLLDQARRFEDQSFRQAFEKFLAVDLAIKSSSGEPRIRLECLVMELAAMGH